MDIEPKMRWAERQRMDWIGNRRAPFNRADLMKAFDISTPQASHDIKKFMTLWPGMWEYNPKKKIFERGKTND